jgi:hypothetical protein
VSGGTARTRRRIAAMADMHPVYGAGRAVARWMAWVRPGARNWKFEAC